MALDCSNRLASFETVAIGDCLLIRGDCLEVLPHLAGVADMLFCDVAYPLTSGGTSGQAMRGIFAPDRYNNSGLLMDVVPWRDLGGPFFRACQDNADAYIMANDKNLSAALSAFQGADWKFHNLLVWDKKRATRNRWYMKNLEFTLYLWKGKAKTINDAGSKQLFALNEPRETKHPTEKPIALVAHYIRNSSQPGDLVLDPMMGSGTTLIAALQDGRKAIGIEKSKEWFDVSVARVRAAHQQRGATAC